MPRYLLWLHISQVSGFPGPRGCGSTANLIRTTRLQQGISRDGTNYPISQWSGISMRNRSKRFFGPCIDSTKKTIDLAVAHRTNFRTSEQTLLQEVFY